MDTKSTVVAVGHQSRSRRGLALFAVLVMLMAACSSAEVASDAAVDADAVENSSDFIAMPSEDEETASDDASSDADVATDELDETDDVAQVEEAVSQDDERSDGDSTSGDVQQDRTDTLPFADSPPVPVGAPERHSVLSGGKLFLRGSIPNEGIGQAAVQTLELLLGPGNVISEFTIDPDEPFDSTESSPVYIADAVLFPTGSAVLDPQFFPLLGLGPLLLQLQPGAAIEIVGHTDSVGDDGANLVLSQARVDAVRDWMIANDGDPSRIVARGVGETDPRADNNTAEGRALNRRVEFLVTGVTF